MVIFWSWQSDSDSAANRNFIQDCLEKAGKRVGKASSTIIEVDRDTKGVGGTPNISETILQKIAAADVFVWDASLSTKSPRPAPNPNVLFELGFAVALLGWQRVIGVFNEVEGAPTSLPFDLLHRRWPITYSLRSPPSWPWPISLLVPKDRWLEARKGERDRLVDSLTSAIDQAIKEPKAGFWRSDPDREAARRLWGTLNSAWLRDWHEARTNYVQYEEDKWIDPFNRYIRLPEQPEMQFADPELSRLHAALVDRIERYLGTTATEMVTHGTRGRYVISTKTTNYLSPDDYDKQYERQADLVREHCEAVWEAWQSYAFEVNRRYPDVTEDQSYPPRDHRADEGEP